MLTGFVPFTLRHEHPTPVLPSDASNKGSDDSNSVIYPTSIDYDAQSLIRALLMTNPVGRLGGIMRSTRSIRAHPWFTGVDWDCLAEKGFDAPYKPPVRPGTGDTSMYHKTSEAKVGRPG